MTEPKKKTTTKKPSTTKKPPVKKSSASKKSDALTTKKILTSVPAVKKTPTKKTPSAIAQTNLVKETSNVSVKTPKIPAKKSLTDMSIFTTILAVSVVVLVVLGGYIYSQAYRMDTSVPTPDATVSEPQQIRISSSVVLTPVVMSALEDLVKQIAIWPEEVLTRVTALDNVPAAQSWDSRFYANALEWDIVFRFKTTSVLFRPSTEEIINTGIVAE